MSKPTAVLNGRSARGSISAKKTESAAAKTPQSPQTWPADGAPAPTRAPAGFVTRMIAMSIDLAVVVVVILAAGSVTQIVSLLFPGWTGLTDALRVVVSAIISVVPAAYFFVAVAVTGRTLGKALMGIRVVDRHGGRLSAPRSLARTLAYIVSLLPLGAGFWSVLIDNRRRGWHDRIAGSRVVHDGSPRIA